MNNKYSSDNIALVEKNDKGRDNNFVITRPVYTQKEFDTDYRSTINKILWKDRVSTKVKLYVKTHFSCNEVSKFMLNRLPFITIMRKYKWKEWILADIVGGLIIGVMHIPQGMAYAMLVGLEPMYGLYVSFFPTLIYFFLGTSRHNSIGTDAIVSLLSSKFLDSSLESFPLNLSLSSNNGTVIATEGQMKASRVAGLTLCVGIVQFLMSVFQLGFVTRYLSDPLIAGFTVGAALHVFTSQISTCFGVNIQKPHGVFEVPKTIYQVAINIAKTNVPTFILTLISLALLIVTKEFINPRVIDKIHFPIPVELILIVFGIISSEFLDLHTRYSVKIVGNITQGLPAPMAPDLTYMSVYVGDVFITTFISFSICVALANMFKEKHAYNIQPNQEFLAFGAMNIFSSFFLCYPASASLSRSAVQESIGSKTQVASLIAATLLLFVLLFIGHFFYALPQCILAAFILVALKGMFVKLTELKELWIFSYWDFGTWLITFLTTTILDIDYGLLIGFVLSILTLMLRTQSPKAHILGQVADTDIYKSLETYELCKEIEGVKIFRFEGSLYYASSHHFRRSLYQKIMYHPAKILAKIHDIDNKLKVLGKKIKKEKNMTSECINEVKERQEILQLELARHKTQSIHHVILDCSTWGYIDYVGVKTLFQVINECASVNITVLLANTKSDIRKILDRSYNVIDDQIMYVTVHDAVIASLFDQKKEMEVQMDIRRRMKQMRMVQQWYVEHEARVESMGPDRSSHSSNGSDLNYGSRQRSSSSKR